jgi:hypothetical protein
MLAVNRSCPPDRRSIRPDFGEASRARQLAVGQVKVAHQADFAAAP